MTEEQAKAKWCPLALKIGTLTDMNGVILASGAQNRGLTMDGPLPASMCIASACMMWRKTSDVPGDVLERRDMGAEPPPEGWMRSNVEHPDTINKSFGDWIRPGPWKPTGYCGLAGNPRQ